MSNEIRPKPNRVETLERDLNTVARKFDDPRVIEKAKQIRSNIIKASENFEKRNRVTETTMFLMLSVALFYDALQFVFDFIPILGWVLTSIVGFYSYLTFFVWTSIKGWGFADNVKKWIVRGLQALSIVPVLNFGPEITVGVFLSILIVKSDDFVYNKTKGRFDVERVKEGLEFFNIFREV